MGADETRSPSLDHSDMMMESLESSKKRKLAAEETDLLPLPKHICLEGPSSDIESAECSYAMEDTKASDEASSSASVYMSRDSSDSTGSSGWSSGHATSSIEQWCSKGNDKTQEYVEEIDFICPDFAVEELLGCQASNLEGSYTLSSARWSLSNQETEEATKKATIDQEFEEYFSTLMM